MKLPEDSKEGSCKMRPLSLLASARAALGWGKPKLAQDLHERPAATRAAGASCASEACKPDDVLSFDPIRPVGPEPNNTLLLQPSHAAHEDMGGWGSTPWPNKAAAQTERQSNTGSEEGDITPLPLTIVPMKGNRHKGQQPHMPLPHASGCGSQEHATEQGQEGQPLSGGCSISLKLPSTISLTTNGPSSSLPPSALQGWMEVQDLSTSPNSATGGAKRCFTGLESGDFFTVQRSNLSSGGSLQLAPTAPTSHAQRDHLFTANLQLAFNPTSAQEPPCPLSYSSSTTSAGAGTGQGVALPLMIVGSRGISQVNNPHTSVGSVTWLFDGAGELASGSTTYVDPDLEQDAAYFAFGGGEWDTDASLFETFEPPSARPTSAGMTPPLSPTAAINNARALRRIRRPNMCIAIGRASASGADGPNQQHSAPHTLAARGADEFSAPTSDGAVFIARRGMSLPQRPPAGPWQRHSLDFSVSNTDDAGSHKSSSVHGQSHSSGGGGGRTLSPLARSQASSSPPPDVGNI